MMLMLSPSTYDRHIGDRCQSCTPQRQADFPCKDLSPLFCISDGVSTTTGDMQAVGNAREVTGRWHQMYLCFRVGRNGNAADNVAPDHERSYSLENRNLHVLPPLVNFPGHRVSLNMDSARRNDSNIPSVQSENR